jgi:hypothetical protein
MDGMVLSNYIHKNPGFIPKRSWGRAGNIKTVQEYKQDN